MNTQFHTTDRTNQFVIAIQKLSEAEDAVLNAMEQGKGYTAKEIAVACGFENTQQAAGILTQLVKAGVVSRGEFTPTGKKKDTVMQYTLIPTEE